MNTMQIVLYALLIALCATGLTIVIMLLRPWDLFSNNTPQGQKNLYKIKSTYYSIVLQVYSVLNRPPFSEAIKGLSQTMQYRYMIQEKDAHIKAVEIIMKEIVVTVISTVITMMYFDDTLLAIITTVMIVVYAFNKFMGDGEKFLEELEELIGDMVHIYNAEGQNINRMFTRILEDKNLYLFNYVDSMNTYLKRALMDPDSSSSIIEEFNKLAPSRYLRLIFNYIYITARYGDEVNSAGEQLFNRNMLAIQREVHADLTRMQSIKEETMGEQVFIMLAVVMIPAATWYMNTFFTFEGFTTISRFLNSSFGYSIKLICAIFALICFYIYNRLMASNIAFDTIRNLSWADKLLEKFKWLRELVGKLVPEKDSEKYTELSNKLTLVEGHANIKAFYLKKVGAAIVMTAIVVSFLIFDTFTLYMGITNDIYTGVNKDLMDTIIALDDYSETYKSRSLSNDQLVIDILNQNEEYYFNLSTTEERINYIQTIIRNNNIDYGAYPEIAAQRICEKFVQMGQVDYTIIFFVGIVTLMLSYMVPNLTLTLNLLLNQGAIVYDEVIGYYTIVILLVNHSASNIYMMFNWIESFASIFKSRIRQCIDNLSEKEIRALENGVEYKPLSRLIECLLLAYNGADLQSAFAGIEQRQLFQEESRRRLNEQIIKRRISYSQILSWGALGCTFLLYIMAPMLLSIVEMLGQVI